MNFTFSLPFLYQISCCCGRGRPRSGKTLLFLYIFFTTFVNCGYSRPFGTWRWWVRFHPTLKCWATLGCPSGTRDWRDFRFVNPIGIGGGRSHSGKSLLFLYIFFTGIAFERRPVRAHTFHSCTCSCCSSAGIAPRGALNCNGPVACSIWRCRLRTADMSCVVLRAERSRFSSSLCRR